MSISGPVWVFAFRIALFCLSILVCQGCRIRFSAPPWRSLICLCWSGPSHLLIGLALWHF
ncbi:hypothetical protein BJ742DRAFT_805231 [Cladochytrium replicatum]|nr:hypothetical protein BJ742DRAFT_805231 [Cladochytrium replicatum]